MNESPLITIKKEKEHYLGYIDGEFIASGDTYTECLEEINKFLGKKI